MDRINEAIYLFQEKYGKTPEEAGFPVIDIYEKQHAFLYADSKEVIKAYKTQQNIIRWVLIWYMWPLGLAMINFADALIRCQDPMHWRCLVTYIFFAFWGILLGVLWLKAESADRHMKLGKNITFLNY
ncbi:MAG: hypothetical protein J6N49_05610 [Alphaproteobacteria bacterium]|nr:hypothetical protein [Alphaproteobacteria bacterium]